MQMEKRIESLDVLKGISIILVIIGHLNTSDFTHNLIYNVHLFAFVFSSGVLFKCRDNLCDVIKKDLIRLWLLFLFFSVVWIGFNYIYDFMLFKLRDGTAIEGIGRYVRNSFLALVYGNANLTGASFGAIWYLAMLLSLRACYSLLDRLFKKKIHIITVICIIISFLSIFAFNGCSSSPYYFFSSLSVILVFHIGRMLKDKIKHLESIDTKKIIVLAISCGGGYFTLTTLSGSTNLGANTFSTPWMIYPNMLLGITFLLCISVLCTRVALSKKILGYFGRNSLSIMGWHSEIRICMLFILATIGIDNTLTRNAIIVVVTLVLCIPLNALTNRLITVTNRSDKRLGGQKND